MGKMKQFKPMAPDEEHEQKHLFHWIHQLEHIIEKIELAFHIPNGGSGPLRGLAGKMKGMGMKAGVHDIMLPVSRQGFHGCWCELKSLRRGARPSEQQLEWRDHMVAEGYYVFFAFGHEQALEGLVRYLTGAYLGADLIKRLPMYHRIHGPAFIDQFFPARRRT